LKDIKPSHELLPRFLRFQSVPAIISPNLPKITKPDRSLWLKEKETCTTPRFCNKGFVVVDAADIVVLYS